MRPDEKDGPERLPPAKQRLLAARLARAAAGSSNRTIPRADDPERFPATSPQARFWFLQDLAPDDPAYNIHAAIRIDGKLDADRLSAAITAVARNYPVVLGRFESRGGALEQVCEPDAVPQLQRHQLSGAADTGVMLAELAGVPFSLSDSPLIRFHLLEAPEAPAVLLVVVHHIVSDEPSMGRILNAISRHYTSSGEEAGPEEAASFGDYAYWFQEQLPHVLESGLPYWRDKLAKLDAKCRIPPDLPPAPRQTRRRGKLIRRRLAADVGKRIVDAARGQDVTLFSFVMAAWFALLHRYTGQRDFAVGTPASLRNLPELANTVGLLINTLVLRESVDPEETFEGFLKSVNTTALEAFGHQDVPLESIVQALNPARGAGENPFFDTMLVLEQEPPPVGRFAKHETQRIEVDAEVCKFDLTAFVRKTGNGLMLSIEYDTALYSAERIECVLDHFTNLLASAADRPETAIGELEMLDAGEAEWLKVASRGPWNDVGHTPLVADAVFENLERMGQVAAVVDGTGALSYAGLGRRVAAISEVLRERNGAPGCVAVLLQRGHSAIATMLAAWGAGASYAVLDTDYPASRLRAMLAELSASDVGDVLVVTDRKHAENLDSKHEILLIDEMPEASSDTPVSITSREEDDIAYVVFTSGSTGRPKGVRISHGNLRISTFARSLVYGPAGPRRFLLLSSLSFDSSIAGLYWTLATGNMLLVPDADQARDARQIAAIIERERISDTLMLPSLYALVLRAADPGQLVSLERVIVAGEACPSAIATEHARHVPDAELHNEYGPSEATVWATVHEVEDASDPLPIGRPIPSMRAYVLSDSGLLVPPGVAGVLYLGGPAVSPGYLRRDDDEQAFADIKISGRLRRLYRTGDQVSLDSGRRLVFHGRVDEQVKVRGHRVELEEINKSLERLSGVIESATIHDVPNQRLVSFVVLDRKCNHADLSHALRERLPEYMVPASIRPTGQLPRLPNGKLDVARLVESSSPVDTSTDEPGDDTFLALKRLWCNALGIADSHPTDDFFSLGGHSLLAVQFLLDVEDEFGVTLSLATLYSSSRLIDIYRQVNGIDPAASEDILYPAKLSGSERPLFTVRTPLRDLVHEIHPELPLFGMFFKANGPEQVNFDVRAIAELHVNAIRNFQPEGPYRLGGYSFGCTLAIEMTRQLQSAGEDVECLVLIDPPPPVPEGDLRFRFNRAFARVWAAPTIAGKLRQSGRLSSRLAAAALRRLLRTRSAARNTDAVIQADVDWARRAMKDYDYDPLHVPVLLVVPSRPGVSAAKQTGRWDDILTGDVEVVVVDGPEHLDLLTTPWAGTIARAINRRLVSSRSKNLQPTQS